MDSSPEYLAKLSQGTTYRLSEQESAKRLLQTSEVIMRNPISETYLHCLDTLADAIDDEIVPASSLIEFVLGIISTGVAEKELSALGNLVKSLEAYDITEATEPFADLAYTTMSESLDETFDESDVFGNGYDLAAANRVLTNMIDEKFSSWHASLSNALIDGIVDAYDVKYRMKRFFQEEEQSYVSPRAEQNRLEALDVDDLFSRER